MAPAGSKENAPLPQISFRKVEDGDTTQPMGVHDGAARNYGYNGFKPFERPEHYIRHIEPLETELANQVEYDMDEQDQEWLDAMNRERKKEQMDQVTYEIFEVIMDRLEKEWFDLMKLIPKPDMALPSEDSSCAICDDGEAENSNAILFCDGCNLAVHQDCYGVPYIPEGQWLCRKCTVSPENPVSCLLCPNEGGAFKQTNRGEWAHLLCAIWIPEVTLGNAFIMEPIESIENIPKSRWKLICSLCKERMGACIQCDVKTCFAAFHVTCARKNKLLMAMKSLPGQDDQPLRAFCEKHLPKQLKELREAEAASPQPSTTGDSQRPTEGEDQQETDTQPPRSPSLDPNNVALKSARAHSSKFSGIGGPPLVPNLIIERILSYIHKTRILKKPLFVIAVAKYWSLKRESRRGAPLLKRLHLEPWTASSMSKQQTDEEKAKKLENLIRLRKDLEKVRMLAELTRKREKEKLRSAQMIQDFVANFLFPFNSSLKKILIEVISYDKAHQFRHPVSPNEVPTYYEIVKKPMCWSAIQEKLDNLEYCDAQEFKDDCNLVLENVMLFHPPTTAIHRSAAKIKAAIGPVLDKVDRLLGIPPPRNEDSTQVAEEGANQDVEVEVEEEKPPKDTSESPPIIGNLETSLEALAILLDGCQIEEELEYILPLNQDPIHFLLSFDPGKLKPRPPSAALPSATDIVAPSDEVAELVPKEEAGTGSEEPSDRMEVEEPVAAGVPDTAMASPSPAPKQGTPDPQAEIVTPAAKSKPRKGRKSSSSTKSSTRKTSVKRTTPAEAEAEPEEPPGEAREDLDVEPEDSGVSHAPLPMPQDTPQTPSTNHQPSPVEDQPQPTATAIEAGEVVAEVEETASAIAAMNTAKNPKKRKRPTDEIDEDEVASARSSSPYSQKDDSSVKKRRRASSVEHELVPPVVADVGHHDSFLLFNKGWVLPEGSRRHERRVLPPLVRRGHKPSKLSTLVASADGEEMQPEGGTSEASPNLLGFSAGTTTESDLPRSRPITPVAEGEKPEEEVSAPPPPSPPPAPPAPLASPPAPAPAPAPAPPSEPVEQESELSDLSSEESEHGHQKKTRSSNRRFAIAQAIDKPVKVRPESNSVANSVREGSVGAEQSEASQKLSIPGLFEGGTLVWAKQATFPYFPAVVFEEDDVDEIPRNVLADKEVYAEQAGEDGPMTLVRFYDTTSSWGWIPPSKIKMLGEDRGSAIQDCQYEELM
ncbi:nuA3 HAT complex component nto1 [Tulasnella sp. 424]|nr:nuA3 HAT complex component nto1 [Tulasnella sp. 424]